VSMHRRLEPPVGLFQCRKKLPCLGSAVRFSYRLPWHSYALRLHWRCFPTIFINKVCERNRQFEHGLPQSFCLILTCVHLFWTLTGVRCERKPAVVFDALPASLWPMGKPFSDDSLYLPLPLVPSVYLVMDLQTDRKKFAGVIGGGTPSALVPSTPRLDATGLPSPALPSSTSTLPASLSTLALPLRDTRQLSVTLPTPASPMFPALLPPSPLLSPLHALPPLPGIGSLSLVHTPSAATPSPGSISSHNRTSNVRGVGFFLLVTAVCMHEVR
jgi:hypothetical protein